MSEKYKESDVIDYTWSGPNLIELIGVVIAKNLVKINKNLESISSVNPSMVGDIIRENGKLKYQISKLKKELKKRDKNDNP